jgi:hypothetical protein
MRILAAIFLFSVLQKTKISKALLLKDLFFINNLFFEINTLGLRKKLSNSGKPGI